MKNIDTPMDVEVKLIHPEETEYVKIGCHKVDERIDEITKFIKSRQGSLEGYTEGDMYNVPVVDVYYIESVDDRTFLYLEKETYESRKRLYELEKVTDSFHFIRISKSVIVNLMKVDSIKPALNGRFSCKLKNGEEVIISRKYVQALKEKLKG